MINAYKFSRKNEKKPFLYFLSILVANRPLNTLSYHAHYFLILTKE